MNGGLLYLLDTNMATYILSGRSVEARKRMKEAQEHATIALSTISQAEILFGIEKKPGAVRLRSAVEAFFATVRMLPWDEEAAEAYGRLRAKLTASGKSLSAMDMLIAAHALSTGAVLVTRDKAFVQVQPMIAVTDWANDLV